MKYIFKLIANMPSYFSAILIGGVTFLFIGSGCDHTTTSHPNADALAAKQPDRISLSAKEKDELAKIYSLAISDCLKLLKTEYKLTFDTLFFGQRVFGESDDFPDIVLPGVIDHTNIRLISQEQGEKKQREFKESFYVNLIGHVNAKDAEFIFVFFSNGFAHQFDCFMNYKYSAEKKAMVIESSRFENYQYKKSTGKLST